MIAVCMVAIAIILITLSRYLSRLLITRSWWIKEMNRVMGIHRRPPSQRQQVLNRQRFLTEVKRSITAHLSAIVRHDLALQPVKLPRDADLNLRNQPKLLLDASQDFVKAFYQEQVNGKLLILGAAGSGKTTLLLELAQYLIQQAEADAQQPLPILLNLASWNDQYASFEQWLLVELRAKYGVRPDIGKFWLESQQLLPLLDGLNELQDESLQDRCVQAINQFQRTFQPIGLVVTSQLPLQRYATPIDLKGALVLHPLTAGQIQAYLDAIAQPRLWQIIQSRPELLNLVKSPLLLNLLILAWGDDAIAVDETLPLTTPRDLLQVYTQQMLQRKPLAHKTKPPQSAQSLRSQTAPPETLHWLSWLAQNLQRHQQSEFLIERLQPQWLPNPWQQALHRLIVVLIAMTGVGAIALVVDQISELGITSPVFWGLLAGAIAAFPSRIHLIESLAWSREQARQGLKAGLIRGLAGCLCIGVFLAAICSVVFLIDPIYLQELRETLVAGAIVGMVMILLSGVMGALLTGLLGPAIERRVFPNQGIWRSAKNTLIFALTGLIVGMLMTGLCSGIVDLFFDIVTKLVRMPPMLRVLYYPPVILKTGLMIGVISGLMAGLAGLQHGVLRVMLWCNRSIPWNYAQFLQEATERKLIQQSGGRYRFVHRLLQDFIAQAYSSPSVPSSAASELRVVGSKTT